MMRSAAPVLFLLGLAFLGPQVQLAPLRPQAPTTVSPSLDAPSGGVCPALPTPAGPIVEVSTPTELENAVNTVASGTTICITDGTYDLDGIYLRIDVPGVTVRSASGNREAVVLDGNYTTTEIIQVAASNVTIADVTLQEARYHPIHVSSDNSDTEHTLIYNVHIIDPGQQAIKINPGHQEGYYPDDGEIACSHIELTDTGRAWVRDINGSCYTGGVDAHQTRGWIVRDNVVEGFWCEDGLSEHAVHFWRTSRDTLVERNHLMDNARGVGFGMATSGDGRAYPDGPCPAAGGGYVDHYGGIIRNNFVFVGRSGLFDSAAGFDCGICLWNACGTQVLHNSVAATQAPRSSSIEWRFDYTYADITNNLVSHRLLRRDAATAHLLGNLEHQPLSLFVDGSAGDLHLSAEALDAIDHGTTVAPGLCDDDIDGGMRPVGAGRDVGADEFRLPWHSFLPMVMRQLWSNAWSAQVNRD